MKDSPRITVICGPTATGKTSLALKLAQTYNLDIISADSRQVYKYMSVMTGKDIPQYFNYVNDPLPIYTNGHINIYGYDLINPDQDFSIAHYLAYVHQALNHITNRNRQPIFVGGTGYYLKAIFNPPQTLFIPPNPTLRSKLQVLTAQELLQQLTIRDSQKAATLNSSDRHNKARLIRALEVINQPSHLPQWFIDHQHYIHHAQVKWIGLTAERKQLYKRIDARVDDRINPSLVAELEVLKQHNYLSKAPARTLGYEQWMAYKDGAISQHEAITRWKAAEHAYARRQMTWFKKQPHIAWFDVNEEYQSQVVNSLHEWYTQK